MESIKANVEGFHHSSKLKVESVKYDTSKEKPGGSTKSEEPEASVKREDD